MRNRYLEAFKEPGNILGLTSALATTFAFVGTPFMILPLAVGIAAELIYLAFVPDMKWYQARLSKLYDADVEKRREEIKAKTLPSLRPEMRGRFKRLEEMRAEIERNSSDDAAWFREILRKLDFLLEKFLQFAVKEAQFHAYLLSTLEDVQRENKNSLSKSSPGHVLRHAANAQAAKRNQSNGVLSSEDRWVQGAVDEIQNFYERDLAEVKHLRELEQDNGTQAVLDKRLEVLTRRREFALKIGRILTNLNHQLCLLEDTFGLISDEIRARPPEQVLADIEDVVTQTNSMTQALEEMAPFEQMLNRITA